MDAAHRLVDHHLRSGGAERVPVHGMDNGGMLYADIRQWVELQISRGMLTPSKGKYVMRGKLRGDTIVEF